MSGLEPDGASWRLAIGEAEGSGAHRHPAVLADRVVLATPAFVTASLLMRIAPEVAAVLAGIDHASVALVALAVPARRRRPPARRIGVPGTTVLREAAHRLLVGDVEVAAPRRRPVDRACCGPRPGGPATNGRWR